MRVTYNWLRDFVDIKIPAQQLAQRLTMAGLEVTSLEKRDVDFVFELEITSNRPDWLSVIGIAREVAAITGKKMSASPPVSQLAGRKIKAGPQADRLTINIQDRKDCYLYNAKIITGIQVKPSPDWLKRRLELVGLRSVNSIVDITNYVLMETGQPLHTFDLSKLVNRSTSHPVSQLVSIIVRRAKNGEEIITIDGIKRNLDENILIIASDTSEKIGRLVNWQTGRPIAIAGIMGGLDSEINEMTEGLLLEAAVFNPIVTRRASRILGLSSESSYRFERGIDWQNVEFASMRAVNLILKLSRGKCILSKTAHKPKVKKKILILKTEEVNRILGTDYASAQQIKKILSSLSFLVNPVRKKSPNGKRLSNKVKRQGQDFKITVPSFRMDVNQPVDLIEEIARISGYENIPTTLPRIVPQLETIPVWDRVRVVRDILISQGLNEVITYSLISRSLAYEFGYSQAQLISIANPLTSQQEVLRPTLIPGLISCIGYNLNQKQKNIRIFEICSNFRGNQEQTFLSLACSDKEFNSDLSYSNPALSCRKGGVNLLHIKGILELLLARSGIIDFEFVKSNSEHPFFQKEVSLTLMLNPGRNTDSRISNGTGKRICANLGMIKSDVLERFDIKDLIFAAELNLEVLFAAIRKVQKRYIPIPLYPEISRDISVVLKEDTAAGDIIKRITINKIPYLLQVNVKDSYRGKQIPPGHKGLTLSCIYRASDHTLTNEEAESAHQKIIDILKNEFSARQR